MTTKSAVNGGNYLLRSSERESIFRELALSEDPIDDSTHTLFTIEKEVHGVLMTFGELDDNFSIKRVSAHPIRQKPFNERTLRFFRLANQVGLLQPAIKFWAFLGSPQASRRSKAWKKLSSWFTRQTARKNQLALAANN